ncbi:autophagocytosis associated protein [Umbelopsis sp. PMI_123]|nr:autophagocytosis associated protein [Umbelopsis sp. PMI_123]
MHPIIKLTRTEFVESLNAFVEKAHRVAPEDEWQLTEHSVSKQIYLQKKQTVLYQTSKNHEQPTTEFEICEETPDTATLESHTTDINIITAEYHIVYSPTYCVPVLYFNAYYADGSSLTRSELEHHVFSKVHVDALQNNSLIQQGAISQHDHPLLGQPFFYVHPCDTSALMAQLQITNTLSYIISWISFFGSPVGLYIGPDYISKD